MIRSMVFPRRGRAHPLFLGSILLLLAGLATGCGTAEVARQGSSASASRAAPSARPEAAQESAPEQRTTSADPGKVLRLEKVRSRLKSAAKDWYGTPYKWGGDSKQGVDCSGFVQHVYEDAFAYGLPRVTETQLQSGTIVARDQIRPGDLVFFQPEDEYNHVGVYLGDGTFVHASSSDGVTKSPIARDYWSRYYWTARRPLTPSSIPNELASELLAYQDSGSDTTAQRAKAPAAGNEPNQTGSRGNKIASCDAANVECAEPSTAASAGDAGSNTTRKGW